MTREALAEKVDVSVNFISDIEYGNKSPSAKTLFLLVQALDVTADYVLSGNTYDIDTDEHAGEICSEIMGILTGCDSEQLKSFRDISIIYVDALKNDGLAPKG